MRMLLIEHSLITYVLLPVVEGIEWRWEIFYCSAQQLMKSSPPPLGFAMHPSIQFVTAMSSSKWAFIPFANTCSQAMRLPIPSHGIYLPEEVLLFEVYDYAFCNSYFGLV